MLADSGFAKLTELIDASRSELAQFSFGALEVQQHLRLANGDVDYDLSRFCWHGQAAFAAGIPGMPSAKLSLS